MMSNVEIRNHPKFYNVYISGSQERLKLYTKKSKIKLGFALARGKREIDKREKIKKRDIEREIKKMGE